MGGYPYPTFSPWSSSVFICSQEDKGNPQTCTFYLRVLDGLLSSKTVCRSFRENNTEVSVSQWKRPDVPNIS